MTKNEIRIYYTVIPFIILFVCSSLFSISYAQVVLDGTLGQGGVLSGPDYMISGEMGSTMGRNLFHSFSDFNLSVGESATFSGPDSIANILTRVTGNNASTLDGLLRSTIPPRGFLLHESQWCLLRSQCRIGCGRFVCGQYRGLYRVRGWWPF